MHIIISIFIRDGIKNGKARTSLYKRYRSLYVDILSKDGSMSVKLSTKNQRRMLAYILSVEKYH